MTLRELAQVDRARVWQRPLFSAVITFGVVWTVVTLPPEAKLAGLWALLGAGAVLYFVRGVVDKGELTQWLRIWKGRENEHAG